MTEQRKPLRLQDVWLAGQLGTELQRLREAAKALETMELTAKVGVSFKYKDPNAPTRRSYQGLIEAASSLGGVLPNQDSERRFEMGVNREAFVRLIDNEIARISVALREMGVDPL